MSGSIYWQTLSGGLSLLITQRGRPAFHSNYIDGAIVQQESGFSPHFSPGVSSTSLLLPRELLMSAPVNQSFVISIMNAQDTPTRSVFNGCICGLGWPFVYAPDVLNGSGSQPPPSVVSRFIVCGVVNDPY